MSMVLNNMMAHICLLEGNQYFSNGRLTTGDTAIQHKICKQIRNEENETTLNGVVASIRAQHKPQR